MDRYAPHRFVVMDIDDPKVDPKTGTVSIMCHGANGMLIEAVLPRHVVERCAEVVKTVRDA